MMVSKLDIVEATLREIIVGSPFRMDRTPTGIWIHHNDDVANDMFWFDIQGGEVAFIMDTATTADVPSMGDPEWPRVFKEVVQKELKVIERCFKNQSA